MHMLHTTPAIMTLTSTVTVTKGLIIGRSARF
jgi:hypothetical protein